MPDLKKKFFLISIPLTASKFTDYSFSSIRELLFSNKHFNIIKSVLFFNIFSFENLIIAILRN